MMSGSFVISLLVHLAVLLILGGIVIVPAAVEKFMPVTSVAPPPMEIPEPPPMDEALSDPTEESGSPIGEVKEAIPQSQEEASVVDALVIDSSTAQSPRLNTGLGAGTIDTEAFAARASGANGLGGSGGGAGRGTGKKTFFGSTEKIENTLVGRLYSFKQDRARHLTPRTMANIQEKLMDFIAQRFAVSALKELFVSPTLLYTTYVMLPNIPSEEAPKAFNVEKEMQPGNWMIHYTGWVAPTVDGIYRFTGSCDGYLIVAVDGKVVLDGSVINAWEHKPRGHDWMIHGDITKWVNTAPIIPSRFNYIPLVPGDWIPWRAKELHKLDIVLFSNGTLSSYSLLMEEKGRQYKKNEKGEPSLPLFRVSSALVRMPADTKESAYPDFIMGPVFTARHQQ